MIIVRDRLFYNVWVIFYFGIVIEWDLYVFVMYKCRNARSIKDT